MKKKSKQLMWGCIVVAIGRVVTAAASGFRPSLCVMPSQGMEPTVALNSRYWLNLNAYQNVTQVHRGDVVLFAQPKPSTTQSLRRVVGIPGDKVRMRGTSLWINGVKMKHVFVAKKPAGTVFKEGNYKVFYSDKPGDPTAHNVAMATVPSNQFFVLGDHRDDTLDSRMIGCIPFTSIQGRAIGK